MQNNFTRKPLVLITGAAGNIGGSLINFLSDDYTVVGLDLDCSSAQADCIEFDISDADSVAGAFETLREKHGGRIAAVIHLAAFFDFTGEENPLYEKVNVQGTRNLMRALQNFQVERFIYSGTMLVHAAKRPGERINEDTPLDPRWPYPQSKAKTEEIIREERGEIPITLFHLAGLYDGRTAVPTLSHQIARIYERDLKGRLFAGNRSAGQAMIHKDDMLDAFRRAVDRRKDLPEAGVILAGEPEGVAYQALQNQIGGLIHGEEEWATISVPKPMAKVGAWVEEKAEPAVPDAIDQGEKPFIRPFMVDMAEDHYSLDISRADDWLGWRPAHDIRDEMPGIIQALKEDPVRWYKDNDITPPDWLQAVEEETDKPEDALEDYYAQYHADHRQFRWAHMFNAALGLWLITSPAVMEYGAAAMVWSDMLSGAALLILGLLSVSWRMAPARWAAAAVGFWLLAAPLVFWTPSAAIYVNGTLAGSLAIGFAVLTRPTPGVSRAAGAAGPDIPPGWEFSPSSWFQRLPIILLALVGFFISRHMAAYQLGHIDGIWDPFFAGAAGNAKNGSEEITTSAVSEAWPVSDAGLGALTYMLEILIGVIGSSNRWRTMPWLVMLFGFMIVPLGVVSITFIIIQPIIIGTWCTVCLIAAAAMLIQIPYSLDELVATTQFLIRKKKNGRPLLRIFFVGDTDDGKGRASDNFVRNPIAMIGDMVTGGVSLHWSLALSAAVGVWLMFTRLTLGAENGMANADHLIGSLVVTTTVIATAETARPVRFLNIIYGAALFATPFMYGVGGEQMAASLICGVGLIALSIPRGRIRSSYGGLNKYLV